MRVINDLFDYENRSIIQDTEFFKFSLDSILLAEFAQIKDDDFVLDLCAGNMAIPLILSTYTNAKIVGFELQEKVYKLALESIKLNNQESNLKVINDNVNNIKDYYKSETFDVMVCNPPYFRENEALVNLSEEKKIARHEIYLKLENIFILAKTYLKNKGTLYIVHRALRLDEIISLATEYHIMVKKLQFISTKKGCNPEIVLVKCIKNAHSGIKINHELCISDYKTYKNIFKEDK